MTANSMFHYRAPGRINHKQPAGQRVHETRRKSFLWLPGVAAIVVYLNTLGHGFVFDDISGIIQNPLVIGFSGFQDIPAALLQPWRSVVVLSYALNHLVSGFDGRIFHLTNLAIHAVNAVLVGAIAREAAGLWMEKEKADRFALAAGLIFAVHPLFSEAVAYIWGRSSSLCGMFYFGSLLSVMVGCRKTERSDRVLYFALALLAGLLAWKTKEEAITLPLIVSAFLFLRGHKRAAAVVLLAPLAMVLLRYDLVARLVSEVGENRRLVDAGSAPALKPGAYFLTHIEVSALYYFAKFVLPLGLNADPSVKAVTSVADARFIVALLCLGTLAIAGAVSIRRARTVSFGFCALLLSPLAAYSFMPLADVVAEHRAYITGLGFSLLLASAVVWKVRYSGPILLAVSMLFGAATILRNRIWENSLTLWTDAVKKSPTAARPHLNLGIAYQERERLEEALAEFDQALSINPKLAPALVNRGAVFFQRGELDRAEIELKRAIEIAPERPLPYQNLAAIALARKQPEAALPWLDKAIALEETAVCRFMQGEALLQLGRQDEAARAYRRASELPAVSQGLSTRIEQRLDQLKRRDS